MMPIVRTEVLKNPFNGQTGVVNVVLDNLGRECVWVYDCYYLLRKDGTIGKKKTKQW